MLFAFQKSKLSIVVPGIQNTFSSMPEVDVNKNK